jgi:hypothetical protein
VLCPSGRSRGRPNAGVKKGRGYTGGLFQQRGVNGRVRGERQPGAGVRMNEIALTLEHDRRS